MKSTNEILRSLREDRDLTQSNIAELIGTTQQQYSNYETGESELPLRALSVLSDFYAVSADYLLGRKDCLYGVPGLDKRVTKDTTVGSVIANILSLSAEGRVALIEYIDLWKAKEAYEKLSE